MRLGLLGEAVGAGSLVQALGVGVGWPALGFHGCRDILCCHTLAPHPTQDHQILLLGGPPLHSWSLLLVLVGMFH